MQRTFRRFLFALAGIFQLLFCPTTEAVHEEIYTIPKSFAYWRNSNAILDPLTEIPLPDFMETAFNYFPVSCAFSRETVEELPTTASLSRLSNDREFHDALQAEEHETWVWEQCESFLWDLYDPELSACPTMKLGGYPYWIQNDNTPLCDCGLPMDFLIQLFGSEYTGMEHNYRWIPLSDRWAVDNWRTDPAAEAILRPPLFDFSGYYYYVFVCRRCPAWPVRLIWQYGG